MSDQPQVPTIAQILASLDETHAWLQETVGRLSDPLPDAPDAGGWTVRQLLSHLSGAFVRVPIHASFVTHGDGTIPLEVGDPYWLPEWETAPVAAFSASLAAGYHGCKAYLERIEASQLTAIGQTPFGPMPLAVFLMISVSGHPLRFHKEQLEAFVA